MVSSFLVCAADRGPVGKASRPRVTDTCAAASSVTFRGLGVSLSPSRADERRTSPAVKHSPPGSSAFYWESGDRLSVRTSKTSPAAQLAQRQSVRSLSPSPRRPGHQDPFAEDISSEAEEEAASRRRRVGVACTPRVVVGKGVDDHVQARWKAFRTSGYGLLAKTSPKKLSTQAEGVRPGVVASDGDSIAKPQPDLAGNASASGGEADSASDNAAPEVEQRVCERESILHPAHHLRSRPAGPLPAAQHSGDVSRPRSVRESVRTAVRRELRETLSWRAGDRGLSVAEDSSSAAPCVREREAARAAAVESEHERRQRIRAAYTPQAVRARAEEERDVQRRRDTARRAPARRLAGRGELRGESRNATDTRFSVDRSGIATRRPSLEKSHTYTCPPSSTYLFPCGSLPGSPKGTLRHRNSSSQRAEDTAPVYQSSSDRFQFSQLLR